MLKPAAGYRRRKSARPSFGRKRAYSAGSIASPVAASVIPAAPSSFPRKRESSITPACAGMQALLSTFSVRFSISPACGGDTRGADVHLAHTIGER